MRYKKIDPRLFIKNRKKLSQKMKPASLLILNSNDLFPRNGDQFFPFRQNSDLFWASGLDQENTILLIFPDCPIKAYRECAFISEADEKTEIWEGKKLSISDAKEISGMDNVFCLDSFEVVLNELMCYAENVYLNAIELPKFSSDVPYKDIRFNEKIRKKYPMHQYVRAAPLIYPLRMIKDPIEIALISQAGNITAKAFHRVLECCKPGMMEYEIEAEIMCAFLKNAAAGSAFHPIVASGKNALSLHYEKNDAPCRKGDLLLLDFGAEYANYAADMSRTIPVNGKFSKRQKECYSSVLKVFEQAKALMIPGNTINDLNNEVNTLMEEEMIRLGLFTRADLNNQDPEKPLRTKYFMHGVSHFMGLDVHDVGLKNSPFQEGMVLTCEPGIYIKEENMGIRIENDILITKNQPQDLLKDVPVQIEDIEAIMRAAG
jgi:Xaa-Pro aminopeptidase